MAHHVDVVEAGIVAASRCEQLVANAEPPRDRTAPRVHLLTAPAVAKLGLALEHEDPPPCHGQLARGDRAGEPAADDDDVVFRGHRITLQVKAIAYPDASAAQHRAWRAPSAAATRPRVNQLARRPSYVASRRSSNAPMPRPSIFTNDSFIVHSRTIAVPSLPSGSSSFATKA